MLGSFHAYEIGYVFGMGGLGPIENKELSEYMLSYWTNFSKFCDLFAMMGKFLIFSLPYNISSFTK